jgi:cell division transport system ATP-binding protein
MIALHGVSKVFGVGPTRIHALSDVSLRIEKGEFAVLHGRSGAGKTTLLRLLYRDEIPTEGEIQIGDFDVRRLSRRRIPALRRMIGVVFQDAKLLPGRTVSENIAFILRVLGRPRREIMERTSAALKAVGLTARAHVYPAQLSQGEAQRAALARAIAKEPPLLLADEPTGNLDDEIAGEIFDLITDFWLRGTTVLLATHQADVVKRLRRRTLMLQNGRLLKDEG